MITHSVIITSDKVVVDGQTLPHKEQGSAMLTELYRSYVGDYPKFFKMDTLCKVGFLASELLLNAEGDRNFEPREDRAVILFNRSSSLQADTHYQSTIQEADNFYPSPAAFVYTLPNIVTGEIAIRNKFMGETSFMVIEDYDEQTIMQNLANAFQDPVTESVISGWCDCMDEEHFEAKLFLNNKLSNR
ncbi:MAG: hypothetical protein SPK72_04030 [Bacteroidales bacterium]|jgi:hypothetical protein|nr:hypothetical protein [Bacteroidales bacterium]